jgi:hypothetical protein
MHADRGTAVGEEKQQSASDEQGPPVWKQQTLKLPSAGAQTTPLPLSQHSPLESHHSRMEAQPQSPVTETKDLLQQVLEELPFGSSSGMQLQTPIVHQGVSPVQTLPQLPQLLESVKGSTQPMSPQIFPGQSAQAPLPQKPPQHSKLKSH